MENVVIQHNILYALGHQKTQSSEHYFPEHALGIMLSGESYYFSNDGTFVMREGTICLMRKNELFKKLKKAGPNGEPPSLICIFLDQKSLLQYAAENDVPKQSGYKGHAMIDLTGNVFLKGFFDSLLPYVDHPSKLTAKLAELKTREAIELLLQSGDVYRKLLFDFQEPHKMDLETYMNHNFKYNIPLSSFAKLAGRSLSTFKRDFTKIFETSPEKWLQQKRLEQAHYLISKRSMRPSEVYLEVGFENLSHFSFAFKKTFGLTPTELIEQNRSEIAN
ncbi:AraC family transcriptional regulator [Dyadobacter chenwenxiniae]|uniref:AraC family transcriptional regulator n=1 Tax=Dyadobacter chenwenxiniae TaxID=2906456 RepID=A0A9X1TDF3_9BACT|nr:AraC family transcriptional regulator [Dyadobacter chenwenxiniae]MCF0060624.1 AraC family transcriptional regulator [Dyadobacter chenwenxiniae]UON80456.1 AraC family transcriptional regulator [Dyadobacter chenwenxiniae]